MSENKPMSWKPIRPLGRQDPLATALRFSPTAWGKLVYLRDLGSTEVGGFAITAADDLLFVEDVRMIRQCCTSVTVKFEDQAVADYFDEQIDAGLTPEQFSRIWVHTHPGNSPDPSPTDEKTFSRVFGFMDWAVMFILAEGGQTYARLRFNIGPGGDLLIPVFVDYAIPFTGSDHQRWHDEYAKNLVDEDRRAREAFDYRMEFAASGLTGIGDTAIERRYLADPFRCGGRGDDEFQLLWEKYQYEY